MADPQRPETGDAALVRRMIVEVETSPDTFEVLEAVQEFKFEIGDNMVDTSTFDTPWKRGEKTSQSWKVTVKVARHTTLDGTEYPAVQEFLRALGIGKVGNEAKANIRFCELWDGPRVEAYKGRSSVGWAPEGGDMDAADSVTITFEGSGPLNFIDHPYPSV